MISISELTKHRLKKKEYWDKIFGNILSICHRHIKQVAKQNISKCFYEVPTCVMGLPVYNLHDCIKFIIKKLTDNDLDVTLRLPRTLLISWEKHQHDYVKPVQIRTYIPEPPPRIQDVVPERQLYYNTPVSPVQQQTPNYFLDEEVMTLMPPPKLHYIKPKYPDSLVVSTRPTSTRPPKKQKEPRVVKPQRTVKSREINQENIEIKKKSKYEFNFI